MSNDKSEQAGNRLDLKHKNNPLHRSQDMFTTLLDSLEAIVYVTDIKTNEVLYINKYAENIFGDVVGKTCWRAIQVGQTGPCDFCTNDKLLDSDGQPAGVYYWEFKNTVNNRWYDIRDRAIEWIDGRIARLEIATDITKRKETEEEKERLIVELKNAIAEIKTLSGMLPICSGCNKIRDDKGYWNQVADYISTHSEAEFTHCICPDCAKRLYPDYFGENI